MSGGNLLAHGWFFAFGAVFLGGVLTSLTPCVYPLITITLSIFGARGDDVPRSRAILLATMYVAGICVMYSSLGVFSGMSGKAFGTFMAYKGVIIPIAALYLVLASSMFGAFELSLPSSLQSRLSMIGGKGFGGAFAMGLVGGIIAAPCTGPVLASVLLYVATTRSAVLGGALLFTYALGMGLIFFAVAAFALALPKSGAWMDAVKSIFGVTMVVAALYFLRNVWPPLGHYGSRSDRFLLINLGLLAAGALVGGIHLSFHDSWPRRLRKALGLAALVAGTFGVVVFLLTPPVAPASATARPPLAWVRGEAAGVAQAKATHRPAVIDFFADWCIPCREMDVKTFSDARVQAEFDRFQLVKMDCSSDDDSVVKETQTRYHADTLPTVILLGSDGKVAQKIDHFVTPDELLPLLQAVR